MSALDPDRLEPKDSDTKVKLRAKLDEALSQLKALRTELAGYEAMVALGVPHENQSAIIEQIESLAGDTDRPSAPQTPEQWSRCLREILLGREWELMTWR